MTPTGKGDMEMDDQMVQQMHLYARLRDEVGEGSATFGHWARMTEEVAAELERQHTTGPAVPRQAGDAGRAQRRARQQAREWGRAALGFVLVGGGGLLAAGLLHVTMLEVYLVAGFVLVAGGAAMVVSIRQHRLAAGLAAQLRQSAWSARGGGLGFQSNSASRPASTPDRSRSSGITTVTFSGSSEPRLP